MSFKHALQIPVLAGWYGLQATLGNKNQNAIEEINAAMMGIDMPLLNEGTLYVEAAGIASGDIARKAAEIYEQGDYDQVIFAGGKRPSEDMFAHHYEIDPSSVGWVNDLSEAQFAAQEFEKALSEKKRAVFKQSNHTFFVDGTNTGEKFKLARAHIKADNSVQIVALLPEALRSIKTAAKEFGADTVISVAGAELPSLELTRENWQDDTLGYSFVMLERAKTLGLAGKAPLFEEFFDPAFDVSAMTDNVYAINAQEIPEQGMGGVVQGPWVGAGSDAVDKGWDPT